MDFVIQWLWYLFAFVAGSAVAWVIANTLRKRAGDGQGSPDATGPRIGGWR
ncbi:channel accessory protein ArfB [Mycobacterium malmoense]|uniref:channel accessory protein ArfB n=1 Tax=Mycobacterium malmoense TaxID=1780 RepID=UPI0015A5CF9F|nr:hypothetical protein [Mycobacterium malmoense]